MYLAASSTRSALPTRISARRCASVCTVTASGSCPRHERQPGVTIARSIACDTARGSARSSITAFTVIATRSEPGWSSDPMIFSTVSSWSVVPTTTIALVRSLGSIRTAFCSLRRCPTARSKRSVSAMFRIVGSMSITRAFLSVMMRNCMSCDAAGVSNALASDLTCSKSSSDEATTSDPLRASPTTATRLATFAPGRDETCARSLKKRWSAPATCGASARSSFTVRTGRPLVSAESTCATIFFTSSMSSCRARTTNRLEESSAEIRILLALA